MYGRCSGEGNVDSLWIVAEIADANRRSVRGIYSAPSLTARILNSAF